MGNCFGGSRNDTRILMLGLDAAGKSTILYRLKTGGVQVTVPTIGFNVEALTYNGMEFTVWDLGGQDTTRDLWKHYFTGTHAIIFVVDSNDRERLAGTDPSNPKKTSAKHELFKLLNEEQLKEAIVLIYANKQDLPAAVSEEELKKLLSLNDLKDRTWKLQLCSAKAGQGLTEGLDWLAEALKNRNKS